MSVALVQASATFMPRHNRYLNQIHEESVCIYTSVNKKWQPLRLSI